MDCIYPHGRPVPTTAWSQIRPPRHTVSCEHAPFLPAIPSCRGPTPFLRVSEWPSTHLEPTDKKNSCHSKWPWGPGRNLAEDTATGTPAPQLQGRDLRLCLWDLAEGRSTVMDSVHLDSVGFCRGSILVRGGPCWMLAVPGKGSDEGITLFTEPWAQGMARDEQPKGQDYAQIQTLRVQILEMPSKTSVCTLKPEADAKPGMPMCLGLWQDGSVALWDIAERKVCSQITCHEEPVMGLDFDSQKAKGVSGCAGKVLAVWSLGDQQSLQVKKTHELTNPGVAEVTIRPDRKLLATAGWDHRIRVFHWRTMKPLAVLAFHSAPVYCVAFAADGLLAAGSKDQRISIWSLYPCP
ncbi:Guanine nucleotide-binding protein subunit beta-like protein 1 [Apodemus speciosus]|uniref:Guanine nucleotide-binding protein subunit beta-like protein 1 n=1 Tax=Apodemus speciosus TaxID=105296 RepID=A0ABQ0FLJ4_APOSI